MVPVITDVSSMNYQQHYRDTWIRIAGRIAIVVISLPLVYMIGFMVGFAVYPKAAILVGAIWTAIIVIIGVIMYTSEYADRWKTIEMPWDTTTQASRLMAVPLLEAFVVREIVMSIVVSIFEIVTLLKVLERVQSLDVERVSQLTKVLNDMAIGGNRFTPVEPFHEYLAEIRVLIAANVVWTKTNKGSLMIGINRKYQTSG